MSRRKSKHYNNNVIIDNKVVSVSYLQTNAKSASMRFLILILGIVMLSSMIVPYLSMAAAATSSSNAFNGTVIPGYSMGGLELTAYGVTLNSWAKVDAQKPKFIQSNYGIWNKNNMPKNADKIAEAYKETSDEDTQVSSSEKLMNSSDKSSGWEALTGATNYSQSNLNGLTTTTQNQKYDDVVPIRTLSDYNYWNSKIPSSNSSNDAKITVSLYPDFIILAKDKDGHANIIQNPNEVNDTLVDIDQNKLQYTQAKPIYVPIIKLMEAYKSELSQISDGPYTMDDLFKAISNNNSILDTIVDSSKNDLLGSIDVPYENLNGISSGETATNPFNPYPYTMVFSTDDTITNQKVTSSIYENCEAYVYFSPSIVYQKYLQVKNEYLTLMNSATQNINERDSVTIVQIGYYCAAMAILEAYLNESLPQDMTRGYVGMSEDSKVRGKSDGSQVGMGYQNNYAGYLNLSSSDAKSFHKITYATLMYDVSAYLTKSSNVTNLNETDAIMDNLSVFGYNAANNRTLSAGVMKGLQRDENFNRRTNLTPLTTENNGTIEQKTDKIEKALASNNGEDSSAVLREEQNAASSYRNETNTLPGFLGESNNAGIYTPCYYPIQQHKMPDSEKTYRFSIIANVPYDTVVKYINAANGLVSGVQLSYSSNFASSLSSIKDYINNGKYVSKVTQLVQQYNSDTENTGLDLKEFDASKSISIAAADEQEDEKSDASGVDSIETTTESNVQTRVDSALQGYVASNMTSDNVHDMVDIIRSVPGLKFETFYRNFNPLKSDGNDQDVFITRVTPAVTTYFPATLVKGYENAGGAEVPDSCTTANVSFDYFSIASFAPCFASHSASTTYYGSLNYELRAFYRKGFISTLSNTSNTPQVEQLQQANEQVNEVQKDSKIDSDTMKTNLVTIFVEAKRLAAGKALKKLQTYEKDATGKLDMAIVEKYFDVFKGAFQESGKMQESKDDGKYYIKSDDDNCYEANSGWIEDGSSKVTTFKASDIDSFDFLKKKGVKNIYWHAGNEKPGDDEDTDTFLGGEDEFILNEITSKGDADDGIILFEEDGHNGIEVGSTLQGSWNKKEFKMKAVFSKGGKADLLGPIYYNDSKFSLVENEQYLIQCDSLFTGKGSDYYWMDYHDYEKLDAKIAIDHGGDIEADDGKKETQSLFVVGYYPKYLFDKAKASVTADKYVNAAKKKLDEACQELFKDLTNQMKDIKLLQASMPSQMQNVLAWADYQNASDSEGQYQSDPTDTTELNLDTDASDDYNNASKITGLSSLTNAGYKFDEKTYEVTASDSAIGATNSAIQARMERGVEGSTWTYSQQPACYTMTAIIARIENMQNSGVSYPYVNIYSGRLRSGTDQYAMLQAHVIDYSSIASGISGDLATRVHGKVVSITNPNYGALPDFLNILGTIGGIIAEATSGFANLTGSMFEDIMWGSNEDNAATVATSNNQNSTNQIQTNKYDGTGNIERKGSMWVLSSTGGQSIYTLIQSLALVLVLISLLYIAFKNFYEYTKPSTAATSIDDKDDAGKKSAAAEKKILAATQLKVVLPRAIIAVFMIGLPPMGNGTGFQGGNFLLLQMLSSIFNQISYVFMNLNGQSVMNLWLNTGADLLSDNPNFGEYLAYGVAMLVIGVMFIVGTIAVYVMDFILISFYLIGPLLWALYVWPYNDTTSKVEKPDGLIAKLTSKMKVAWTAGRVGNKAPEGMIECYCQTAMLNVIWAVIFWAVTIIFTGITGTISTGDTSSTSGNTATLANAASSPSSYAMSALMSTGNYNASASIAHADGILNSGILPIPAWGRMLIAALLSVVVFMLMIKMASGMFKKSLFNTFGAVSAVGGAIRGGLVGGALGSAAKAIKVGANAAEGINRVKNIADTARNAADRFGKASARGKLHQIANGARSLGSHGANAARKVGTASQNAGKYLSGDKNLTGGFRKSVSGINRRLNEYAAANQMNTLKRISGTNDDVKALKAALGTNDIAKAQELLDGMTPEQKRRLSQYAPQLFEESRNGHNLQLKQDVRSSDFDRIENRLNDRTESLQDRIDRRLQHSDDAVSQAEVRERALERAGIEDAAVLSSTLLDPNADSRTKRDARRRLADYSRFMGYNTDVNSLSDAQAAKLLEGTTTARDRATRIEDDASNAAYAGHNAARGVAHRLGYDGDANDVTVRELGRVNDSINQILPTAVATSTDVSGIRNTLDSHIDKLSDIYIQRGFDPSEARVHAISEIQSQHGPMMSSDEARFLASEITKGKEIQSEDLVRLELFRQNNNIGNGQLGDRILEKGKGLNEASYRYYLPQIDNGLLNHDALHAKEVLQNVADYQNYANNYQIAGSAYNDELTRMINALPAGRERRQFERAMQASPFNALFNSGRAISRNDLDAIMQSEESAGRIVPAEVKAAIENIYSTVSNSAFENNDDFKNGILANMSTNTYSSGEEAFRELQGYEPNYEILQKQISDSVNDNLTAASAEVRKVTAELATITTELSAQRARYAKAFSDADANEQKAASAEITRLESLQVNKQTELTNAQHNETNIENQLHSLHVSAPVSTTTSSKKPL